MTSRVLCKRVCLPTFPKLVIFIHKTSFHSRVANARNDFIHESSNGNEKKWKSKFCVGELLQIVAHSLFGLRQQIIETVFISRGGQMEFYCLRASCDCFRRRTRSADLHTRFARTTTTSASIFGFCRHSNVEDRENVRSLAAFNARLNVVDASPKKSAIIR